MSRAITPPKRRPPIRLVLAAMLLIAMATPLVGLFFLRVVENQLVRRAEAELIGQAAALAPVSASVIARAPVEPVWFGPAPKGLFDPATAGAPAAVAPRLDLAADPILAPRPAGASPQSPLPPAYREAGTAMAPILAEAGRRTGAALTLLDAAGRVTEGPEAGLSRAGAEEVAQALEGAYASVLRQRPGPAPPGWLSALARGGHVEVWVAYPVIVEGRVAGAIHAGRAPLRVMEMLGAERGKMLLALLAMILAILAIGAVANRALVAPIRALTERTRAVAAGDRDALRPLDMHGTAEVAELSETFLRTARRLHDRSDDVAAFAANVSHELKTPLTSIQGAAELIRDSEDVMTAEERRGFLDNMIKDSGRMALLVRRLLELARAESREAGAPPARLADALALIGAEAPLPIALDDPAGPRLAIDAEKLGIVISNLAENAAKHGATRLSVTVRARRDIAEIEIADDGPGVSPKNQPRIFEPFFTTRRGEGGTGMGLPIVKALIEARGGGIELVPSGPGARFLVRLPLARA